MDDDLEYAKGPWSTEVRQARAKTSRSPTNAKNKRGARPAAAMGAVSGSGRQILRGSSAVRQARRARLARVRAVDAINALAFRLPEASPLSFAARGGCRAFGPRRPSMRKIKPCPAPACAVLVIAGRQTGAVFPQGGAAGKKRGKKPAPSGSREEALSRPAPFAPSLVFGQRSRRCSTPLLDASGAGARRSSPLGREKAESRRRGVKNPAFGWRAGARVARRAFFSSPATARRRKKTRSPKKQKTCPLTTTTNDPNTTGG